METAIHQKLERIHGGSSDFTIFRVPFHVREENKKLYEPWLVSIGPYYRGRDELRAMEQHKWRFLRQFLQRAATVPLSGFVEAVRAVEARARCCYSERTGIFDDDGDGDGFAEMLLLDGCFVLELFFKLSCGDRDALCDVGWGLTLLRSDLLLLDNQIPFFVLERLFAAFFNGSPAAETLVNIILGGLKATDIVFQMRKPCPGPTPPAGRIDHLLHLFHEAFVPKPDAPVAVTCLQSSAPPPLPLVIPRVTRLREAGVRFVKKPSPRDMFDITFDSNRGVMEMPRLAIDLLQARLPLLFSLVAFEQSFTGRNSGTAATAPLTSYTALLSSLFKGGDDLGELQRPGIVEESVLCSGGDEAASGFFQRLTVADFGTLSYDDDHLFGALFADVKRYHDKNWRRHKAMFVRRVRERCSNPLSVIGLVLVLLAFVFSMFHQLVAIYNLIHG